MFDIEQQIRDWRQQQLAALAGRAEAVDELESHLREELNRLIQSGQAPAAAWAQALARLGTPSQLAVEFGKLTGTGPLSWLPARVVLVLEGLLAVGLTALLLTRWRDGRIGFLLVAHLLTITLGYTLAFAIGILGVWAVLTRALKGWDERRNQALRAISLRLAIAGLLLTGSGVVLGALWASEHLGRLWGWDLREVGGLAVLAWQAVVFLCLLRTRRRATMLLGVVANIVVSLAWFAPALLEPLVSADGPPAPDHSYGVPILIGWLLAGFVASQVLVFAAAFLPEGHAGTVARHPDHAR